MTETLKEALDESGLGRMAIYVIEDVLYSDPYPPSMRRFMHRIGSITCKDMAYEKYRLRVYTRLLRMYRYKQGNLHHD